MPLSSDNGLFLPNTKVFNPDQLGRELSQEERLSQVLTLQYLSYEDIAAVVNLKESAYYIPVEFVTGQQWFRQANGSPNNPFSFGVRRVVNFGALPNTATKSVAHNITGITPGNFSWTNIKGAATDAAANGLTLPFSSPTLNENIKLTADATNVHVTTAIDYSAFTNCYIVLEYLKDSF
jgi:hypothetical protein